MESQRFDLKAIVGAGDKVMLFALPGAGLVVAANLLWPAAFAVDPAVAPWVAAPLLALGLAGWLWSAALVLRRVPRGELIATGPFRLVRHPLYLSVGLLVAPAVGLLCGSWGGCAVGLLVWLGAKLFARAEDSALAERFGESYRNYRRAVLLPWL